MITAAWEQLRYHPVQSALWRTKAKFIAVPAGRGSGKSELARRRVVRFLPIKKPWPDPLYFYALPTRDQAKRVGWVKLLSLIPPEWIKGQPNISELKIETKFGSTLYVIGMDKPQRAEGVQWDGGVLDESSDQKPTAFNLNILPALSHRDAWCWRIGVPKRYGVGARDFKAFCEMPSTATFTWSSEEILTPEQIAWAKENLDPRDYSEQYRATWESTGGLIFYTFTGHNISMDAVYNPMLPIVVGSDFNVNPMCWVLGHIIDGQLFVFDEIFRRNTNTAETLTYLAARYPTHVGWEFYGDATSQARKTSASKSDYLQIRGDERFKAARVYYPKSNPSVVDRFAACNALMCNAKGERRFFIHPRCLHLIEDLNNRVWKEGAREADDYGDIGHMSDGLGYIIHRRFPFMANANKGTAQVAA